MRKVLAVALLDVRRLGFGIASAALVAGLLPSLVSGLGAPVPPGTIFNFVVVLVAVAAGGYFGADFAEGRGSFFFARPLSTAALVAGRVAAALFLAVAALLCFFGTYWMSSRGRQGFEPSFVTRYHAEVLASAWAVSLFLALGVAARGRRSAPAGGLRAAIIIPLRLFASFAAFILIFGLFADLVTRAYFPDRNPIRLVAESWVLAAFLASLAGMAAGRTEPLRISLFQTRVMIGHFVLLSVVIIAAWIHVLHPGPEAIKRVAWSTFGSAEGRTALVSAIVDRGSEESFRPVFILDIASGQARRLDADPFHGPWTSADGSTMVWSQATPLFFRPLWRLAGGSTTFRVRGSSGDISVLPLPRDMPDYTRARDLSNLGGTVDRVLPSPAGDVFAVLWDRHLTFTSRSGGELSDIKLGSGNPFVRAMAFLPSGDLRAVIIRQAPSANLEIVDVDPKTGTMKPRFSTRFDLASYVSLDRDAMRALVRTAGQNNRTSSITLLDLRGDGEPRPTVILKDVFSPAALFLADGRIATASGGPAGDWGKRTLGVLSPEGRFVRDIPISAGATVRLGNEMFPGILAVRTAQFTDELSLIDATSGAVTRKLSGFSTLNYFFVSPPPPGTAAARLLLSGDGKLYELPSLTAEPRLLLPSAKP